MNVDLLRADGEAFMQALSREYYRAHAGLAQSADLQSIYGRFPQLTSDDALSMTREAFLGATEGSDEQRSARMLLDWVADSRVARELAALDEREIAWEASAIARLSDGRAMPYSRIAIEIANATDREERRMLERARSALVAAELAPLRRERFERERDLVDALEIAPGYIATFEALSSIDVGALVTQCEQFLRDTQSMWDDVASERVQRTLGIPLRDATRADALALLRAPEMDRFYPSATMESTVRGQIAEMGIDPMAAGRIIYDTDERVGKRSRAFCSPVRVPDEVYLVLRPHGGQQDWRTLLHELGHAMHFAYARPSLPFESRWLGDNSVTEAYAMLFDHLLQDAGWLRRYTAVGSAQLEPLLRNAGFEELHFLRRYCGKLRYERALWDGSVPWQSLPDLYVETLGAANGFRYDAADAFVDVDARLYAARYLRAWQLQALLAETLVARFDEDWWRNPRAGPWIAEQLFGEGQRELATEIATRIGAGELSFAPLVRSVERLLA